MLIGHRLRILRKAKGLRQRDLERIAGLRCSYASLVENNHVEPTIETLEKWAKALDIPLFAIFYEEETTKTAFTESLPEGSPKDRKFVRRLRGYLARMKPEDRELLLRFAFVVSKQRQISACRQRGTKTIVQKQGIATLAR